MTYLTNRSEEEGEDYYDWTDIIDAIRKELNSYRERDLVKVKEYQSEHYFDGPKESKFKVDDIVHYKLDKPKDVYGNRLVGDFRMGDRKFSIDAKKIVSVLMMNDAPWYRYKLKDMPHVSYSDAQLKMSKGGVQTMTVKSIIGKKKIKGIVHYLVWWRGEKKSEFTYEPKASLLADGLQDYIDSFESKA